SCAGPVRAAWCASVSSISANSPATSIIFMLKETTKGKGNVLLFPSEKVGHQKPRSRVHCREHLGGLLKYSYAACNIFGWPEHAFRGCSLGADQVAHLAHLNVRDTTLLYASRAPQKDIERLKARMGWKVPWYTITDSFDTDFGVNEWHGHNVRRRGD